MQFDVRLKNIGDVRWVLTAIDRKLRFGLLRRYTSAFTDTGYNMNLRPDGQREMAGIIKSAPLWARQLRGLIVLQHRLKRWYTGAYRQDPFSYEIFTRASRGKRVSFRVDKPAFLWRSRFRMFG